MAKASLYMRVPVSCKDPLPKVQSPPWHPLSFSQALRANRKPSSVRKAARAFSIGRKGGRQPAHYRAKRVWPAWGARKWASWSSGCLWVGASMGYYPEAPSLPWCFSETAIVPKTLSYGVWNDLFFIAASVQNIRAIPAGLGRNSLTFSRCKRW